MVRCWREKMTAFILIPALSLLVMLQGQALSSEVIKGSLALPVAEAGGAVQVSKDRWKVRLDVGEFSEVGFDRFGTWGQDCLYEHAYGGDRDGYFAYRFNGPTVPVSGVEVQARLSAESQTSGLPEETSDVTLALNGVELGTQTVLPDNGEGRIHTWHLPDRSLLAALKLRPGAENELRFTVKKTASNQHGLCIYGRSVDASRAGSAIPILVTLTLKAGR